MTKAAKVIGNVLYTALVIGVLTLALLFVGTKVDLLGYEVKVVKSGSMEPAIHVGSIVVVASGDNYSYRVGETITFGRDTRQSVPVTHRIVDTVGEGSGLTYITKGDANEESDPVPVRPRDILGKVTLTLPYLGYAIEFARTSLGFALLIGIPAAIIVLDEFANIVWEVHKYRARVRRLRERRMESIRQRNQGLV